MLKACRVLMIAILSIATGSASSAQTAGDRAVLKIPVKLDVRDAPLLDVLRALREQCDGRVNYNETLVRNETRRVTYKANGAALGDVLQVVLEGTSLVPRVNTSGATVTLEPSQLPSGPADTIRGRVVFPDSTPAFDVLVIATETSTGMRKSTRTNKAGEYTFIIMGRGEYEIVVLKIGMARQQVPATRSTGNIVRVRDIILSAPANRLNAVTVEAIRREAPGPDGFDLESSASNIGGTDLGYQLPNNPLAGRVTDAVLGTYADRNGMSVFGLPSSQSTVTLNGMPFIGPLTTGAVSMGMFRTTTFDAAAGGFAGGNLALRLDRQWQNRRVALKTTVDHPDLQWSDAATTRSTGQEFRQYSLHGQLVAGAFGDRIPFQLDLDAERRTNDAPSLVRADAVALQRIGLSSDSLQRLVGLLQTFGLPVGGLGAGGTEITTRKSMTLSMSNDDYTRVKTFTAVLTREDMDPSFLSLQSMPSAGGRSADWGQNYQFTMSNAIKLVRSDFAAGLSFGRRYMRSLTPLPGGNVAIASSGVDGATGLSIVSFGGNPSLDGSYDQSAARITESLSWQTLHLDHRMKLNGEFIRTGFRDQNEQNRLGTFTYASLGDLAAGRPTTFMRALQTPERSNAAMTSSLSLTDAWKASKALRVVWGLRAEGTSFAKSGAYNPLVDSVFGYRTNDTPGEVHLSPRLGFTRSYGRIGHYGQPRGKFFGGIGEFRGTVSPQMVSDALDQNGLPKSRHVLWCAGSAIPTVDWSAFAADASAIPRSCADGSQGSVFASPEPNVVLFDRGYAAPRRWSGSFGWAPKAVGSLSFTATAELSRTLHVGDETDLNFVSTPRFVLAGEGGRPVFVSASNIVPATGGIGIGETRRDSRFGSVRLQTSDLTATARQYTLSLHRFPFGGGSTLSFNVDYAYTDSRSEFRGLSMGTTSGDPLNIERAPSPQPRHDIAGRIGQYWGFSHDGQTYAVRNNLQVMFRLSSGAAFSPVVAGDVNGDGRWNDRAFVFDPASASDAAVARDMGRLLTNGSSTARDCLRRQVGRIAAANSCRGPWNASLDAQYTRSMPGRHSNLEITVTTQNLLGGIDRMLHGASGMHGWGDLAMADPTLLSVDGFDPTTAQFRYKVNPLFGDARRNVFHRPMRIQIGGRVSFSQDQNDLIQTWNYLGLDRHGNGKIDSFDSVRARVKEHMLWSVPFAIAMRGRDSLYLTDEQLTRLTQIARDQMVEIDSLATALARELLAAGPKVPYDTIIKRATGRPNQSVFILELLARWSPPVVDVLSAEQLELDMQLWQMADRVRRDEEAKARARKEGEKKD